MEKSTDNVLNRSIKREFLNFYSFSIMSNADPAQNSFSYHLYIAKDVHRRRTQKPIGPESKIKVPRPRMLKKVWHIKVPRPHMLKKGWHIKVLRPGVKEGVIH